MLMRQVQCMDNFLPTEVIPCNATDRQEIYELDPQGHAYGNIYELRKVCSSWRRVRVLGFLRWLSFLCFQGVMSVGIENARDHDSMRVPSVASASRRS